MAKMIFVAVLLLSFSFEAAAQKKTTKPLRTMTNMQLKRYWTTVDRLPTITDRVFPVFERDRVLVKIENTRYHEIDDRLDRDGRYIRSHVLKALGPLEQIYFKKFNKRLRITGAFRTSEHHEELKTRNNNAAQGRSPHETGCTVDISYLWMSAAEQRFLESWFRPRHKKSLVYTKEYFQKVYDVYFRAPALKPPPRHQHR